MPRRPPPEPDPKIAVLDLAEVACHSFQDIVLALEQVCPGPGLAPGTSIRSVLLESKVARGYGLKVRGDERARAICVSLGRMGEEPQHQFYGWDISEAMLRAIAELLV